MKSSRERHERLLRFGRTSSVLLAGAVAAALAQQAHAEASNSQELDTTIVLGKGESRQVQTLTAAQVEQHTGVAWMITRSSLPASAIGSRTSAWWTSSRCSWMSRISPTGNASRPSRRTPL